MKMEEVNYYEHRPSDVRFRDNIILEANYYSRTIEEQIEASKKEIERQIKAIEDYITQA